jgi:hypothetical protein
MSRLLCAKRTGARPYLNRIDSIHEQAWKPVSGLRPLGRLSGSAGTWQHSGCRRSEQHAEVLLRNRQLAFDEIRAPKNGVHGYAQQGKGQGNLSFSYESTARYQAEWSLRFAGQSCTEFHVHCYPEQLDADASCFEQSDRAADSIALWLTPFLYAAKGRGSPTL